MEELNEEPGFTESNPNSPNCPPSANIVSYTILLISSGAGAKIIKALSLRQSKYPSYRFRLGL
jgi:hypothetical protein